MKSKTVLNEKLKSPAKTINLATNVTKSYEMEVKRQMQIDKYNFEECFEKDIYFDTFQLESDNIIIKLFKENYIKSVTILGDGTELFDCWISQVDGRMHQTQPAKWVDNPLPYINSGVIVAMSPLAVAKEYEKKKKIEELSNGKINYQMLEVGSIVHTKHMNYADVRFYKNKQQRDFIKNPNEYRIQHWEGHVLVHPSIVEGIIIDKNEIYNTSPYYKYVNQK